VDAREDGSPRRNRRSSTSSNQYMIAINEVLGFEILSPPYQWHQMPTAEVR
jgi:hypothetical protein